ncbi:MAG: endopeptidase La [Treponema sp.]|nr:endopeptidase La [Treponema sp.]
MKFFKISNIVPESIREHKNTEEEFPLLPLRDLVIFPQTIISVFITYKSGIAAIEEAIARSLYMFAVCLKTNDQNSTETWDTGTVVRIIQHLRLPDNTFRVVLQGEYRAVLAPGKNHPGSATVWVEPLHAPESGSDSAEGANAAAVNPQTSALMRAVQRSFAQYAELSKKINTEIIAAVEKTENAERLVNIICNSISVRTEKKAELIRITDTAERLDTLLNTLETENEIIGIQKNISGKVKSRMDKSQREYILHEQLREINKELGNEKTDDEYSELEQAINDKNPGEEVYAKACKEIARLRKLPPFSPEAGVLRGYLEWIMDLPWSEYTSDAGTEPGALQTAEKILNEDHYNMKKAKERILEFIAVRQLAAGNYAVNENPADTAQENTVQLNTAQASIAQVSTTPADIAPADAVPANVIPAENKPAGAERAGTERAGIKGPILCFVGPPGTGKTSLGKSVARALGRRFIRISLGGVRDEAEIRGHRKTYVGALPGKIIQSMRKAGTMNPVFLLDEIDKLSTDFRGDPASALLEVLDPEQNFAFTDHYLEVPYDLSKVLFITTANSLHTIPYPLLDRMEIIEIPGYGENEKLEIAKNFLVPKELRENGLEKTKVVFKDDAILEIIRHWTMESGVRNLEREIARCARRIARDAVDGEYGKTADKPIDSYKKTVKKENLEKLLGRRKYKNDVVFKEARIGVSYGLAWTETGGAMLPVETIAFAGSGELVITGNLGDVMKESVRIALSYLRNVRDKYNFHVKDIGKTDFHIHVPEGAIPKDGPSAGITLAASLLSTLCLAPPKSGTAMTGELTLTGRILPIGGLKEKLLAAIRNGMKQVLLPEDNREDWDELDRDIRDSLHADFVGNAEEAFALLFDNKILKKPETGKPAEKLAGRKPADKTARKPKAAANR